MNIGLSFFFLPERLVSLMAPSQIQRSSFLLGFDLTTGKKVMDIIAEMRNSVPAAGQNEICFFFFFNPRWRESSTYIILTSAKAGVVSKVDSILLLSSA